MIDETYDDVVPDGRTRVAQYMNQQQQNRLVCDKCQSAWFYEVLLSQYAAGAYSEMAGGDIQQIGSTQHSIRVCLCGRPIPPSLSGGRVTRGANESQKVAESVDHARDLHDQLVGSIRAVVEGGVTLSQLQAHEEAAKASVSALEARVKALEELLASFSPKTTSQAIKPPINSGKA